MHINAFNFPIWGMLEKVAVNWMAGVPAVVKPATVTSYLTEAMVKDIVASGIVPEGAIQLICGSAEGLLDHVMLSKHEFAERHPGFMDWLQEKRQQWREEREARWREEAAAAEAQQRQQRQLAAEEAAAATVQEEAGGSSLDGSAGGGSELPPAAAEQLPA